MSLPTEEISSPEEISSAEILLRENLQQIYGHIHGKKNRKAWQWVCRGWYNAVNDVARIKIKKMTRFKYNRLADGLNRYPNFGPKIVFIAHKKKVSYNPYYMGFIESDKSAFISVLKSSSSLKYLCLADKCQIMWLYHHLIASDTPGSKQDSQLFPSNLKKITLKSEDMAAEDDISKYYLQVCFELRKTITHLNIYLEHNHGSAEGLLNNEYGRLTRYVSSFPNLTEAEVRFSSERIFLSPPASGAELDLVSLIENASKDLKKIVIADLTSSVVCGKMDPYSHTTTNKNYKLKEIELVFSHITDDVLFYIVEDLVEFESLKLVHLPLNMGLSKQRESFDALLDTFQTYCTSEKL